MKSKARDAAVPDRDGVSRVKCRTVARADSGAASRNVAKAATSYDG
jgi:hypothetical protein